MKQLRLWTARLFSAVVLLALASVGQTVVAQDDGPEEGYYFISSAAHPTDALLYNNTGTDQALRVHYASHVVPSKLTKDDKPFIFEVKKYGDGYTVRNYEANMYIGKVEGMGYGEGAGFVTQPSEIQLPPSAAVDGSYLIANVKDAPQYGPLLGYQGVFNGEQITGYWGQLSDPTAERSWLFDKIDPALLDDIEEITEVEGSLDDGYYFINFSNYSDPTTCMVPVQDGDLWRLGAYPRDNSGYDNSFIWHVTKNADGTYSLKNCGAQELTFVENVGKGDKESPYVIMTGLNPANFKLQFLSNGCAYIFSTDNSYNYAINGESGNIQTSKSQNAASMVKFVQVPAEDVTNPLKLNEAITTALGKQFTVGTNPGQVSQGDYDVFNAVLEKAQAAKGSEDDNSALIAELNEAVETLQGKIIPVEEGYYTFKNGENDVYLKPYFRDNIWYLGHDAVDPFMDASAVWHVVKNADGNLVLKNCGTQDSTYIKSNASGNNWGFVQMSGTSKTYNTFKQQYSNVFKLYASDNDNFWNADGGNRISSNNDYHPLDGVWYVEKVAETDIPFFTKLNEAITDAAGVVKDANIGPNPGDNLGDATELNEVINAARTMYEEASASDGEVDDMIVKLAEATQKFNEQDHSMRGIDDGYYYIVSTQDGFQAKGKIAMYVPSNTYLSWKVLEEKNGQYLFEIKNLGDGTYSVQNVEFERYITSNSANGVATALEQTVPQKFEYNNGTWLISNTVDNGVYTLKTYKTEATGVININDGSNIKDWTLKRELDQKVIDSIKVASEPVRVREDMIRALQKAEPAYKGVFKYVTDRTDGLIKETNEDNPLDGQIWGTQVDDTYTSYAHLIDGDLNTCFQSSWDKGTWGDAVEEGKGQQWLQVDLRSNPVDNFEFYFGLRESDWGWKECWSNIDVYATNDAGIASQETLNAADWTYVGNYKDLTSYIKPDDANMNSSGRYIYYSIRDLDQAYRYIRFMVRSTIVPQSCMMYTIGEFQVYKTIHDTDNDPYTYVEGLKDLADELKQLIDDGNKKVDENTTITQEEVDKIIEITNKVVALTPNTEPLDTRIAEVKAYIGKFGDNDEWGDVTSEQYGTILDAADEADSYDHERPTVADLDTRLNKLNAAFDLYKSQQKQPEAGTWYYISNMDQERAGYDQDGDGGTSNSIYERFCYGNVILAPTTIATKEAYWDGSNKNAVKWGGYDHASATRDESVATNPYAMWRLVNMDVEGEEGTFYALQNRATGLYLGKFGNRNGADGMSAEPVPYSVILCKSGAFFFVCADKVANSGNYPLHADGRRLLVSWDSSENGPSSWTLEPVDEDVENLEIDIQNNAATILALPYAYGDQATASLNADNGVVTYGVKGVSEDGSKLLLYKKDNFAAGEPMIVVAGEIGSLEGDADATVKMFLPLANEYSLVSAAANGLVGVFDYTLLPANVGVIQGDSIVATEENVTALFGQSGYVDASQITNMEGVDTDLTLKIKGDIVNGITIVPAAATGRVNVYTTDGVLVKKNVKAANAKDGLKKGVYIIGRDKVLVK